MPEETRKPGYCDMFFAFNIGMSSGSIEWGCGVMPIPENMGPSTYQGLANLAKRIKETNPLLADCNIFVTSFSYLPIIPANETTSWMVTYWYKDNLSEGYGMMVADIHGPFKLEGVVNLIKGLQIPNPVVLNLQRLYPNKK